MVAESRQLRVLVVEDSEDDALLLLRELERGGYEPEHERVDTPEAMKKALAGSSWDVIFSDYHMPRFLAPEALELAREAGSEAPFIVVSGRIGEETAVEVMKAGAHDYVMKDNLVRLCATVKRGLEEVRERRERGRAEKELRESEERFKVLAEATFEGVAITQEGKIVETNAAFATMFGYDPSEVIGMTPLDVTVPESYASVRNARASELEEPYEATLLRKDGTTFEAEIRGKTFVYKGHTARVTAIRDITERKRTDEELREAEERFRSAFGDAAIGMALVGTDGRWLQVNRSLCHLVGYPEEELRAKSFQDITHPDDLEADLSYARRLLAGEIKTYQMEKRYLHKDGRVVWISLNVSLMRDAEGDPLYFISQMQDVTERKQAEEDLARSENRLRTIIETEPECVKVLGMDGSLLEMNPAGLSMIEADSLEQVRGKTVYDYIAPGNRTDFVALTEEVLHGGSGTLEFELIGLKGTSRWLETHAVPLPEAQGGIAGLLAITRDITERKKNEEKLRASEAELRALFEAMTDLIFVLDAEGRHLKVAPTNPSILYRPPPEIVGKTLHEIFPAKQADEFLGYVRRALETRRGVDFEYGLQIGSRQLWFEGTASPMLKDSVVWVARDITERKENEEALRQSERLYRAVIEQATENIFLVDIETKRILEFNPAFRKTLGYSEAELWRMTLYDIVAADRESIDTNIRRVLERKNPFVGVRKYRRKDGSTVDVEVSASVILRDGKETLCAVAHDVTERVRVQGLLEGYVTGLSRIASDATLNLPMEDMLNALSESAVRASTAVACVVVLIDEGADALHLFGSHGLPEGFTDGLRAAYRDGVPFPALKAFRTRQPVLVRNNRRILLSDPLYAPILRFVREVPWDVTYILPLVSRDRALGAIFFCYPPEEEPSEDERAFLKAVANQTAVAVENARLLFEARDKAALEERQRLARELHDSVSQALYGISLGVETARELLDRDPKEAVGPLDYSLSLTEAGMAEMRALIFELRPESLKTEGLVAALEKQAAAIEARYRVRVQAELCAEPEAPLEAKEAVYRIAQEALHNTVKHARASNVQIRVNRDPNRITLEISDDGAGFDVKSDFPGHLGLRSMRERTSHLGGTLEIESAPKRGTRIRAHIPV